MKRKNKVFIVVVVVVLVLVLLAEFFTGGIVINNMDDYTPEEPVKFEDFTMLIGLFGNNNYNMVPYAVSYMGRSSPYRLSIMGHSDNRSHERMTITSAKIIGGSGKEYLLTNDIFPITGNFKRPIAISTKNTNDDELTYSWYYYFVTELKIPYDEAKKESTVKAVVDFKIETKDGTRKHKVETVFKHEKYFGITTFRQLIMTF
ncbi:MAG: hypothetical protein MUO22_00320 [Sedimentisphaerales bacterium]|nr:hypothetical protein [Sedimentisphaerales bacterium]